MDRREELRARLKNLNKSRIDASTPASTVAPSSAPPAPSFSKPAAAAPKPQAAPPRASAMDAQQPVLSSHISSPSATVSVTSPAPAPSAGASAASSLTQQRLERLRAMAARNQAQVEAARAKKSEEKSSAAATTAPSSSDASISTTESTPASSASSLAAPSTVPSTEGMAAPSGSSFLASKRPREGEAGGRPGFPKRPRMVLSEKQSVRVTGVPAYLPQERVRELMEGVAGAPSTQFTMNESGICIIDFVEHASSLRLLDALKTPHLFGVPVTASLYRRQVPASSGYRDLDAVTPASRAWTAAVTTGITLPGLTRRAAPAAAVEQGPAYESVAEVADVEGWRALVFRRQLVKEDPDFLRQVPSYSDLY